MLILKNPELAIHPSDINTLYDLFLLVNTRCANVLDLRDVLICVAVCRAETPRDAVEMIFRIYDRKELHTIDRRAFCHIVQVVSDCFRYLGDVPLYSSAVDDLVNSM